MTCWYKNELLTIKERFAISRIYAMCPALYGHIKAGTFELILNKTLFGSEAFIEAIHKIGYDIYSISAEGKEELSIVVHRRKNQK